MKQIINKVGNTIIIIDYNKITTIKKMSDTQQENLIINKDEYNFLLLRLDKILQGFCITFVLILHNCHIMGSTLMHML